jgi:uncharacterized membrane protein YedE/YeeE
VIGRLIALLAGGIFGAGLLVSGLTNPRAVLGFLDVAGDWNPALIAVMISAIGVYALLSRLVLRSSRPLFAARFAQPVDAAIDSRLVGGAVLFGVGWAMSGLCPGPAVVVLANGTPQSLTFFAGILLGVALESISFARLDDLGNPHQGET